MRISSRHRCRNSSQSSTEPDRVSENRKKPPPAGGFLLSEYGHSATERQGGDGIDRDGCMPIHKIVNLPCEWTRAGEGRLPVGPEKATRGSRPAQRVEGNQAYRASRTATCVPFLNGVACADPRSPRGSHTARDDQRLGRPPRSWRTIHPIPPASEMPSKGHTAQNSPLQDKRLIPTMPSPMAASVARRLSTR